MKITSALVTAMVTCLALAFTGAVLAKEEAKKDVKAAPAPTAAAKLIDINHASEKDLMTLKGIGDVRAKAIIKGRPYSGKDDLVRKMIVPEAVYNDVKEQIIAKQEPADKKAPAKKAEK
jgi:DNA uptake protein ComE-like DNA-binding protein